MYYKLTITETGRDNLKDEPRIFNKIIETYNSLEEINELFLYKYGRIPKGKNKIFIDDKKGNSIEIGFLYSYWNYDISHMSPKWFQTDWIIITEVNEEPVLIN